MTDLAGRWFPYRVPTWVLVCVVGWFALAESLYWLTHSLGGDGLVALKLRDVSWLFLAALGGGARVYFFHPAIQLDYARWLGLTPWTAARPLPLAPVHLTPQDVLLVALPLAAMHHPTIHWVAFPLAFVLTYLAVIAYTLRLSGWSFAIWLGIGLTIRCSPWPEAALVVAALTYDVAMLGLERWLASFPWPDSPFALKPNESCPHGWPWDVLHGKPDPEDELGTWHYAPLALIAGWLVYCAIEALLAQVPLDPDAKQIALGFGAVACLAGAIVRILILSVRCGSPIDLWGRIATFHWIIPGYDVIFLTPLATLVLPVLCLGALFWLDVPFAIAVALAATLLGLLATAGPPSWRTFRLTGDLRLCLEPSKMQRYTEV